MEIELEKIIICVAIFVSNLSSNFEDKNATKEIYHSILRTKENMKALSEKMCKSYGPLGRKLQRTGHEVGCRGIKFPNNQRRRRCRKPRANSTQVVGQFFGDFHKLQDRSCHSQVLQGCVGPGVGKEVVNRKAKTKKKLMRNNVGFSYGNINCSFSNEQCNCCGGTSS